MIFSFLSLVMFNIKFDINSYTPEPTTNIYFISPWYTVFNVYSPTPSLESNILLSFVSLYFTLSQKNINSRSPKPPYNFLLRILFLRLI
jgi:hypothetical protein